jgi:hypothetical protein
MAAERCHSFAGWRELFVDPTNSRRRGARAIMRASLTGRGSSHATQELAFLGEPPAREWLGIGLIACGVLVLAFKR